MIVEILDPEILEPVREYHVTSIEDASAKWTAIRKLTHVGASEMPRINILDDERNPLGSITYNGSFMSLYEEIRLIGHSPLIDGD